MDFEWTGHAKSADEAVESDADAERCFAVTRPSSVRQRVAHKTRAAHERLHVHPAIGRLIDPSITIDEYKMILQRFFGIYHQAHIRRRTMLCWDAFDLSDHCAALSEDCGGRYDKSEEVFADTKTPQMLLGVLYALHGAQFGGSVIRRSLVRALPDAPLAFFSLRPRPHIWHELVITMQRYESDPIGIAQITEGALEVFVALERICDRPSES